jgi:ankyrin repeat protein
LKLLGADINYTSSYGRTPIIISIVADQMKIMDFLLDNHADCELCDESGGNAMIIAKRFNNKLAQHR